MRFMLLILAMLAIGGCVQTDRSADKWTPLFNGKDLTGFSTFIGGQGKDKDPDGYFKVEGGMIHILGFEPTAARKEFGYLVTEKSYENYHFRAQVKWGEKKFPPRATQPRDSGVLYHMNGRDTIWPQSIECQVQENDIGEMIIVGQNLEVTIPTRRRTPNGIIFDPEGTPTKVTQGRVYKQPIADKLTEWNTVEVITQGNSAVHIVNGVVIMTLSDMMHTDTKQPLSSGKIVLQAEGAEVFYRNIEIRQLRADEKLPRATPVTWPAATRAGN